MFRIPQITSEELSERLVIMDKLRAMKAARSLESPNYHTRRKQ